MAAAIAYRVKFIVGADEGDAMSGHIETPRFT
jgi:hypothetical protein